MRNKKDLATYDMKDGRSVTSFVESTSSAPKPLLALSHAEAKRKFIGMTVVELDPVWDPCGDSENCGNPECRGCRQADCYRIEIGIDDVHTTRRSFLLECNKLAVSFVVAKKQARYFAFDNDVISVSIAEQLHDLDISLEKGQFMYCRAWEQTTRRYPEGRQFIDPCIRETANCLAVVAEHDADVSLVLEADDWKRRGVLNYKFVKACCIETGKVDDTVGMDCWLLQYDPVDDQILHGRN